MFGESVWTRWTLGEERSEPDSERGGVAGGDRGKYLESSGSVRAKTDVVMSGARAGRIKRCGEFLRFKLGSNFEGAAT